MVEERGTGLATVAETDEVDAAAEAEVDAAAAEAEVDAETEGAEAAGATEDDDSTRVEGVDEADEAGAAVGGGPPVGAPRPVVASGALHTPLAAVGEITNPHGPSKKNRAPSSSSIVTTSSSSTYEEELCCPITTLEVN